METITTTRTKEVGLSMAPELNSFREHTTPPKPKIEHREYMGRRFKRGIQVTIKHATAKTHIRIETGSTMIFLTAQSLLIINRNSPTIGAGGSSHPDTLQSLPDYILLLHQNTGGEGRKPTVPDNNYCIVMEFDEISKI